MKSDVSAQAKRPTIADRAVEILHERGPMHYRDLADVLRADGQVKTEGKTFTQTLSAALCRHPDAERVAPGVYKAKEN